MRTFLWMSALIAGAGLFAITAPAQAQQPVNKPEFCGSHFGICQRTCPGGRGQCTNVCEQREKACRSTGCFVYNGRPGTQCFTSAAARARLDLKNAPNPEQARRFRQERATRGATTGSATR